MSLCGDYIVINGLKTVILLFASVVVAHLVFFFLSVKMSCGSTWLEKCRR